MAKIRKDLEGVAMAVGPVGEPIILRAGDKVPEGVEVGEHLLAKKSSSTETEQTPQGAQTAGGGTSTPATVETPAGTPTQPEEVAPLPIPPKVGAGSGTDAWRDYAADATKRAGLKLDIAEGAKRGDIIAALDDAKIATA